MVPSSTSGYLQFVGYAQLVDIAVRTDSVIGQPLATVWPGGAGDQVALALSEAHVSGPHRTLMQDPVFAIDQLVEIAIRALSPAVNDTFTALTCIDWLSARLSQVSSRPPAEGIYRDRFGRVRLIETDPSYARMVNRAFDKIRQSSAGMPAVIILLLDSLRSVALSTVTAGQRHVLVRPAEMILHSAEMSVSERNDLEEIRVRHSRCSWWREVPRKRASHQTARSNEQALEIREGCDRTGCHADAVTE